MKSLLHVFVLALIIPAVVGCSACRRPAPRVVYRPVYVRPVSPPTVNCPPAPSPCAVETLSPVQPVFVSP